MKVWPLGVATILVVCVPATAHATGNDFNIQVSPSPVVVSLTPGQTQTTTLTLRNFSNHSESLQPGITGLQVDKTSQKVTLQSSLPADIASWLHFSPSAITLAPGTSTKLTITFTTPRDIGFNYSVGITLTSSENAGQTNNGAAIKPEVVVFCLININRPDARSQLSIEGFSGDKSHYNFLPANFTIKVKNSGNVISQPSGTIFIQRSFNDATPIATLPINNGGGYSLPGTTRSFSANWNAGFPLYVTTSAGKHYLSWNWKRVSELRFGKYVAKAVLVYDNGRQDVPIITSFSFWVIPWGLLLFVTVTAIILVMGLVTWGWLLFKGTKKMKGYASHAHRKK
ncbi:MAG TPA: Fn3-like domain-containing protein [Patescibacteria group bacterium]|nr:Fn3-like domain-containing protein [Patescibacteria group bacterium]